MLIKGLGEFKLIERFRRQIKLDSSVVLGSSDDCAVLNFNKKKFQLFTCDRELILLVGTTPILWVVKLLKYL